MQSVHDGERYVHEPARLSVFIAAAPDAIATVLARQPEVRALLDNSNDSGRTTHRVCGRSCLGGVVMSGRSYIDTGGSAGAGSMTPSICPGRACYQHYQAARASAEELNRLEEPRVRYFVVADLAEKAP